jgi:ERCC4-type nuclease
MTAVTQLQAGDLWITATDGALLLVERKTASDLLASIADGRLFDQVAAMREVSQWCYVVIQGVPAPTPTGKVGLYGGLDVTNWNWNAVQGALQSAQEAGAVIVYLPDDRLEFERFIIRLAERDRGAMRTKALRQPDLLHPGMIALTGLPGIGLDRAKSLLEALSSAAWALDFLTDEDWQSDKIAGFGNGIKTGVREALGLQPGMKLAVMRSEDDQ